MNSFKHSGDMGDIIYSLPTIRALGGGVLYLDPDGGQAEPLVNWPNHTNTKLNPGSIAALKPLLDRQDYIEGVRIWKGEEVGHNLDTFRLHMKPGRNIADAHLKAFGRPTSERDIRWLEVPLAPHGRPMISRSLRYHGNYGFWDEAPPKLFAQAMFVGLPEEHKYFEMVFGRQVDYVVTSTILDAASQVADCERLYCNQNLWRAVAEGLKVPVTVEEYCVAPNTRFEREGAKYV